MERPLFPPMMQFITCPGVGNLGRGQASIPLSSLQQAGLTSALSTLAEDAVKVRDIEDKGSKFQTGTGKAIPEHLSQRPS